MKRKKRGTPRIDIPEVLRSYSRKVLRDYEEGTKQLPKLAYDRGPGRERAIRQFLRKRLPKRYGVGEGLVVDTAGGQSKQCDVVIYDREHMLVLSTEESLRFWPFEGVYGVGQVKSALTTAELESAVENIAAFKRLKRAANNLVGSEGLYSYGPQQNPAVGMLVAHEVGDIAPGSPEFDKILASVPRDEQIDLFCVISGFTGCRTAKDDPTAVGMFVPEPTEVVTMDFGDGALAAFLMFATQMLNGIRLGPMNWYRYLKLLRDAIVASANQK